MSTLSLSQRQVLQPAKLSLPQLITPLAAGFLAVMTVGFMPLKQVHNARHNSRHTFAFPSH
ncbi:CbtB domain-containing protein [Gynuella sp.]|uniref:CbtB domain-containing protein n=1 Tax=Gynuella sp. TaxID=2969146 RepID=UPI003D1143D0